MMQRARIAIRMPGRLMLLSGLGLPMGPLACVEDPRVDIHVCADFLVPPAGQELVTLADGAVLERARSADEQAGDGDDAAGDELAVDTLRITTRDMDYEPIELSVLELDSGSDKPSRGFDRTLSFPRSTRMRWLLVEGMRFGVVAYAFARRATGDTEAVDMPLSRDCFGVRCAFGLTCIAGECELAPEAGGGPRCGGKNEGGDGE